MKIQGFEKLAQATPEQLQKVWILTPNQRLAQEMLSWYLKQRDASAAFVTPTIQSWSHWQQQLWQTLKLRAACSADEEMRVLWNRQLLRGEQETLLWERIIRQSQWGDGLLKVRATAKLAMEAYRRLAWWELELSDELWRQGEDLSAYLEWHEQFVEECAEQCWLPAADLARLLSQSLDEIALPESIWLTGFEELAPVQQRLLDAMGERGVNWQLLGQSQPIEDGALQEIVACADLQHELLAAAQWARETVAANPQAQVAVIVPELERHRAAVMNTFTPMFAPELAAQRDPVSTRAWFNVSVGIPLLRYPMVKTAVDTLMLYYQKLPLADLSEWLLSPYIAGAQQELAERARLDLVCQERLLEQADWRDLLAVTAQFGDKNDKAAEYETDALRQRHCPLLYEALVQTLEDIPSQGEARPLADWVDTWYRLWRSLGWPGQRGLDSEEYQLQQKCLETMDSLRFLDRVSDPLRAGQALSLLRQSLSETLFQPQSETRRVQVLGPLEAAELPFDAVWMCRMNDDVFPGQPNPNPFIPFSLQREHQLPRATPEREHRFAKQMLNRLLNQYDQVHLSWSMAEGERPLQPSRLLAPWLNRQQKLPLPSTDWWDCYREQELETIDDMAAPKLSQTETVRGGSAILKEQLDCPFKALASYRWGLRAPQKQVQGFDAAERGALIHEVLEHFWQKQRSQENLLALSAEELERWIGVAIQKTLDSFQQKLSSSPSLTQLETQRLHRLTKAWLEKEKQRKPFKVLAVEQRDRFELAGLTGNIRLDRIDQLEDGTWIVIDYKTGKVSVNDWLGDTLKEPQLPLYCLTQGQNQQGARVRGVAFIQLRPEQQELRALVADGVELTASQKPSKSAPIQTSADWGEQVAHWRSQLLEASEEFCQGVAPVAPRDTNSSCRYCELTACCRIHEADTAWERADWVDPSLDDGGEQS